MNVKWEKNISFCSILSQFLSLISAFLVPFQLMLRFYLCCCTAVFLNERQSAHSMETSNFSHFTETMCTKTSNSISLSRVSLHGMLVHEASNIHRSSKHRRDERERSHPIEFHSFCLQLVYKYFPSKLNSINKQGDEIMMRMESEDIDKAHIFMTADSIGPTQKMIERGLHITKIQNVPQTSSILDMLALLRWRENAQEEGIKCNLFNLNEV